MTTAAEAKYSETVTYLKAHADETLQEALNQAGRIRGTAPPNLRDPNFSFNVNKPSVVLPSFSIADFLDEGDLSEEVARLSTQTDDWFAEYFPNVYSNDSVLGLLNYPNKALLNIVNGVSPYGFSAAEQVELDKWQNQLWERSRDRAAKTRSSESEQLYREFSSRGFSIPPGAMVNLRAEAAQRESEAILQVNREETIRESEVKVEMLRFGVEKIIDYKVNVLRLAVDFYKEWANLPDRQFQRDKARAELQQSLYNALVGYYRVELGFEELRLRAAGQVVDTDLNVDRNKISAADVNNANSAIGQAVNALAGISSASANAATALVGVFG